jgi:oxygen-independent coproporphyrinogen-3 oxidase
MEKSVEAISQDLRSLLPGAAGADAAIPTVYIGGGTPSALPPGSLERLLRSVAALLPASVEEWTVEVNPESLTADTLGLFRETGVNRVSLGVQSLAESGLRALGRGATAERTLRSVELLAGQWSGSWNADLIVGYEGDSPERVAGDLQLLTGMGARHLSVYALTVEPGTPLAARVAAGEVSLPGEDALLELLGIAEDILSERGIERYEISNYAVPGDESLHNLRYWRMAPYLGVGPGAASTLYYSGSPVTALRLEGIRSMEEYLRSPASRYRSETLSARELLLEHLLMGLRTREGVSLRRLRERFGIREAAVENALARGPGGPEEGLPAGAAARGALELTPGEPRRLRVPRERWNLLDRAVLRAVERIEPLLS